MHCKEHYQSVSHDDEGRLIPKKTEKNFKDMNINRPQYIIYLQHILYQSMLCEFCRWYLLQVGNTSTIANAIGKSWDWSWLKHWCSIMAYITL